jgi:uncharacterized protein YyaL (SSP411 family)
MIKILLLLFTGLSIAHTQHELTQAYHNKGDAYQPRTKHIKDGKAQFTNHLILEKSPYLLQHAHNPVHWYGFNDEAFNLAKQQNKLIFLSIGYATCHWCHVMEEESFEDLEVAEILNKNFISIKVDREVLPDVDSHFMGIATALTGRGGWPLNVVLTPEGDGFFAGVYFPKHTLIQHLNNLQHLWTTDKQKIFNTVTFVRNAIAEQHTLAQKLPRTLQKTTVETMLQNFDEFYGGFGNAPKFPREVSLLTLIDEQFRNPSDEKLTAITTTLDNMASGGLYDVVGGGFHRYATDNAWLVPHFEKMLYNQAQMIMVYTRAYQLTKKPLYKRIVQQIITYLTTEMQDPSGGYYSATDADSLNQHEETEEGYFFTWSVDELQSILGKDFSSFSEYFNLSDATNFEGKKIIRFNNVNATMDIVKVNRWLQQLYNARKTKNPPLLDNKILLSWNALLLKAFVIASEIDNAYLIRAVQLADFLIKTFYNDTLLRVYIDNSVLQDAIFTDYAYLSDALIALFDTTQNPKYLTLAQKLTDIAIEKFWDKKHFGFIHTTNAKIPSKKEIYDGAIFSNNGIFYGVLNKLADRVKQEKYQDLAHNSLQFFSSRISKNPEYYAGIVQNFTNFKQGELAKTIYLYNGKIKVQRFNNYITIDIAKGWHINANKVLQKGVVATTLTGAKNITYPQSQFIKLGWNSGTLAVHENQIHIKFSDANTLLHLRLQACSDSVCLPPQRATLR